MSTVALLSAALLTQTTAVTLNVDVTKGVHPISPYIYGDNQPDWRGRSKYLTLTRQGGNRMTAYNWENNASNAGSDWFNQNDNYLGGGEIPAEVPRTCAAAALKAGAAVILTIPCTGYVAADKLGGGDVNQTPDYLNIRFKESFPTKGAPLRKIPDLADGAVYQDEFVYSLTKRLPTMANVWFSLDNEPDLWASTHSRIHPDPVTYSEIVDRTKAYAAAIKSQAPTSLLFGPVNYGWYGYATLQDAPDGAGRFFLDYYLAAMRQAQTEAGKRLLDVLDLHWYPEAQGGGVRVTNDGTAPELYAARMQAPRSLWDPTYTEDSWISQWGTYGPIKLIPLVKGKIKNNYPGTKLAFTEWNYGGGDHISGGVAVADVLGVFGRESVFAATYWHLKGDESYAYGGFDMFRNFDGIGGHFGDTSVRAATSDVSKVTVYASTDMIDPSAITVVMINKQFLAQKVRLNLVGLTATPTKARRLISTSSTPKTVSLPRGSGGAYTMNLPATSVTTVRFSR